MRTVCFGIVVALFISFASTRAQTYNIENFGAVGDGSTLDTLAIQKVIDSCRAYRSGTVVVSQGIFVSWTIRLFRGIDLRLQAQSYAMDHGEALCFVG